MVLLIPRAWNRAKAEGRAEARAEERDRVRAILSEYGRNATRRRGASSWTRMPRNACATARATGRTTARARARRRAGRVSLPGGLGPPIAPAPAGRNGGTNQTAQPETRPKPVCRDALYVVAAICAVSAGTALFVAIIVEVTGRMVLLIPRAWNRAKAEGRAEGLTQGRARGRGTGPGAGHPVPVRAARPGNRAPRPGPRCRGTPAQRQGLGCAPAAFLWGRFGAAHRAGASRNDG